MRPTLSAPMGMALPGLAGFAWLAFGVGVLARSAGMPVGYKLWHVYAHFPSPPLIPGYGVGLAKRRVILISFIWNASIC